jgi:glutaredoxin
MENTILIFTLNGCSHCTTLKNALTEQSISYSEIEIGQNQKVWNQIVEQTGHNTLPTVFIKKEGIDDGPVFIAGVDFQNTQEGVEIIKKYV